MPSKPATPCREPRCPNTQPCPVHAARRPFEGAERSNQLYSTSRWTHESKAWLAAHPFCVQCGRLATVVDHEPAPRGNVDAFFDRSRYRSMCAACHNSKTAGEIRKRAREGRIESRKRSSLASGAFGTYTPSHQIEVARGR